MNCACGGCDEKATDVVLGYLTDYQKKMLGWFCKGCVKNECRTACKKVSA